jgi:hypothetical protein
LILSDFLSFERFRSKDKRSKGWRKLLTLPGIRANPNPPRADGPIAAVAGCVRAGDFKFQMEVKQFSAFGERLS